MTSIIYVGMDVHTTNYTLCCYSMEDDRFFAEAQVEPDAKNILKYLARIEKQQSRDCRIVCGYEAGCLGYSLQETSGGLRLRSSLRPILDWCRENAPVVISSNIPVLQKPAIHIFANYL